MIRAALTAGVILSAGGCGGSIGPFVRNVHIEGYYLVVERCTIMAGGDAIGIGTCTTERHRLPVTTPVVGPPTSPGCAADVAPAEDDLEVSLTKDQIRTAIVPLRESVIACGASQGFSGTVRVRLVIDGAGSVAAVESDTGGSALAACITSVFATAHFPASRLGVRFTFPFYMP